MPLDVILRPLYETYALRPLLYLPLRALAGGIAEINVITSNETKIIVNNFFLLIFMEQPRVRSS